MGIVFTNCAINYPKLGIHGTHSTTNKSFDVQHVHVSCFSVKCKNKMGIGHGGEGGDTLKGGANEQIADKFAILFLFHHFCRYPSISHYPCISKSLFLKKVCNCRLTNY